MGSERKEACGRAAEAVDARGLNAGLACAGGMLMREARYVEGAELRRMLLVWALGSLARDAAALEARMRRDIARLTEGKGAKEVAASGLAACMLDALADDARAYRKTASLRAEAYRELGEPAAANAALKACERFAAAHIQENADKLAQLAKRAKHEPVDWRELAAGKADASG